MQRDSSTSDWDMMAPSSGEEYKKAAAAPTLQHPSPLPQSTFQDDDFFSSEQFHRVESADLHWSPAQSTDQPLSGRREAAPTSFPNNGPQGSDADVDSPLPGRRRHDNYPATPPTTGSGGTPSQRMPPHIDTATMQQGFPSSASVESLFNGGAFHHFSPYAASKHTGAAGGGGGGGMKHSYSSSSAATPTSPPPYGSGGFLEATAAAAGSVHSTPPTGAANAASASINAAAAEHQSANGNRPPYFRPPLVPKLSLAAAIEESNASLSSSSSTADPEGLAASPMKMASDYLNGVRSRIRPSLAACLTPRIPSFLCANVEGGGASPQAAQSSVLGDSQRAVLMWDDPLNALVKWTMAMLALDVLHTFSSDSNTWAALTGRTLVLLMVLGKVVQVVHHGTPLVSAMALRGRLTAACDRRREGWVARIAIVGNKMATFVLGVDGSNGAVCSSSSSAASSASASSSATAPPRGTMDAFHAVCRFGLVCGALDLVLRHSPYAAHRMLDVAIFWASFMSLRVPLRLVLSDCLSRGNGVTALRQSFIGPVGTSYLVKSIPSHGFGVRRGPADVACWICLQAVFAVCALF